VEFAILILQTELLLVKKSLRIIERMEVEVQHELNTAALKIQEADLQKAIKRLQEVEGQKPPTNCASPQLLALVGVLKASATVPTTAVLKVLYDEFPQLRA
jgi:hypothetical protein